MAKQLLGIATDETVAPETRLKAVINALDRTIGRAPTTVEIGPTQPKPFELVFDVIGGTPPDESPGASVDYGLAGNSSGSSAQSDLFYSTQPPNPPTGHNNSTATHERSKTPARSAGEDGEPSWDAGPLREAEHREFDRDSQRGPRESARRASTPGREEVHIAGVDAIRSANEATRQSGALLPHPELESQRRPYREL